MNNIAYLIIFLGVFAACTNRPNTTPPPDTGGPGPDTLPTLRLTGDALIRAVRSIRPDLPVVLCTGYSQVMDEEKAKEMAIDAFVMKPLEREDVGRIVSTVLAARGG